MPDKPYIKFVQAALLASLLLLMALSLVNAPGSSDVAKYWIPWGNNAADFGSPARFAIDVAPEAYPPYGAVLLEIVVRLARWSGSDVFTAIKLSIILFLGLTSALIWLWTRSFLVAVLVYLALLVNSAALGYIDAFVAPSLILALWALKEKKWVWFAVFYTLACLTKWQPIIIGPFLVIYLLNIQHIKHWRQIDLKKMIGQVLLPAGVVLLLTAAIFGAAPLLLSFQKASSDEFVSANALNFSWIETHWLHVFFPKEFGGLIAGEAGYIVNASLRVGLLPKLFFFLTYGIALVTFFRREKTFEDLLNFSLIGYLAYYTFNTGVHENHLFIAAIVGIVLFWLNRRYLTLAILLILMSNINLILFYGIDGKELPFSRVVANVDLALLLSVFNVIFFLVLWGVNLLPRQQAAHDR